MDQIIEGEGVIVAIRDTYYSGTTSNNAGQIIKQTRDRLVTAFFETDTSSLTESDKVVRPKGPLVVGEKRTFQSARGARSMFTIERFDPDKYVAK